ncbi:MAG: 1-acyl-sn-glycerol-3-phosphate acyltransferase [Bacteroidetes bacterium]|nr:1-acyl-sn-glycerol-3-phosphate acyltransferase [Bacteroidota bacterium]
MKTVLSKIFLVYVFFWLVLIFLILYPLFRYYLADPKRYTKAHKLRVLWANLLLYCCFTRKKVVFEEPFDKTKTYVIVSNHASYIDIASLAICLPIDFNYMAKIELSKVPLFGIFFRTLDISVDRKSPIQSAKAYIRASQQLKNRIKSLAIFPEGGIRPIAPKLSPFKEGPFKMAIDAQVHILPISLPDNYKILNSKNNGALPGVMRIYVHKPIDTKGMSLEQVTEITQSVHDLIKSKLDN